MSRTRPFTKKTLQRGGTIVEALVGMALASLIALSSVYALARSTRTQYVNNVRTQVVDALRSQIQTNGVALCATKSNIAVGKATVEAVYTCTEYSSPTVTFPGANSVVVPVKPTEAQIITASVKTPLVGGTLTVSNAQ